jgi:hypothetical protein
MVTFNQGLRPHMGEEQLLALVATSDEFESMMVGAAWLGLLGVWSTEGLMGLLLYHLLVLFLALLQGLLDRLLLRLPLPYLPGNLS